MIMYDNLGYEELCSCVKAEVTLLKGDLVRQKLHKINILIALKRVNKDIRLLEDKIQLLAELPAKYLNK